MLEASSRSEFRAWRRRRLTALLVLCASSIPVGVAMGLPHVWILGIAGTAAAGTKLRLMERRGHGAGAETTSAPHAQADKSPAPGATEGTS